MLVGNPQLLILDEATSALDAESVSSRLLPIRLPAEDYIALCVRSFAVRYFIKQELVVQEALDNILERKKITTIIIAHRLSTIRSADVINVLVSGHIVESGTHMSLMDKGGYYRKLVEKQDGTANDSGSNSALSSRRSSEVDLQKLENGENDMADQLMRANLSIPHIAFRDVTFAYPTRPKKTIFDGFNLEIKQGETVALCGPRYVAVTTRFLMECCFVSSSSNFSRPFCSGGGKSTTVGLIERFYDPASGAIEYLGNDLRSLNVYWYRDQIGYVGQEPTLFNGASGLTLPKCWYTRCNRTNLTSGIRSPIVPQIQLQTI